MLRRFHAYAAYGLLLLGAIAVAASNPLLFQKMNTLRRAEGIPDLDTSRGFVDIASVVGRIPLNGHEVWCVDPATRWRGTVLEGGGNCSQMCFGLAYQLDREGVDYQIIHMLTPKGVGHGDGHTVIRLPYRFDGVERVGLVDVSFGSILTGDGVPLDVAQVAAPPVEGWGHIPLNAAARFPNYHDDFLVDAVIGYVPPSEVHDYYAFIQRVYFSLGADKPEKYVFDGLALLLGHLPEVYVPEYDRLLRTHRLDLFLHRGALAVMRSALLIVPGILGFEALRRRR
ncbi:MAG TPA: hypothetical protein VKB65_03625 [Myxococcota bacterium]|nr:hypothetical protein [Myxococcota bacterium]